MMSRLAGGYQMWQRRRRRWLWCFYAVTVLLFKDSGGENLKQLYSFFSVFPRFFSACLVENVCGMRLLQTNCACLSDGPSDCTRACGSSSSHQNASCFSVATWICCGCGRVIEGWVSKVAIFVAILVMGWGESLRHY